MLPPSWTTELSTLLPESVRILALTPQLPRRPEGLGACMRTAAEPETEIEMGNREREREWDGELETTRRGSGRKGGSDGQAWRRTSSPELGMSYTTSSPSFGRRTLHTSLRMARTSSSCCIRSHFPTHRFHAIILILMWLLAPGSERRRSRYHVVERDIHHHRNLES